MRPPLASTIAIALAACGHGAPEETRATPSSPSTTAPSPALPAAKASDVPTTEAPAAPSSTAIASADEVPEDLLRRGLLVVVPRALTGPSPLLIFLHPEGVSGPRFTHDLGVELIARRYLFAYATPDGARVSWQASTAAWGAGAPPARQDEEIAALITIARRKPNVDPSRIYVVGWESGGFMAHHLACAVPGIRGVFSIGGAGPAKSDPPCAPEGPIDVVEIHGTKDHRVLYGGGTLDLTPTPPPYPSAKDTFEGWGARLGCSGSAPSTPLEILSDLDGPETSVTAMQGCRGGSRVELWSVQGGGHKLATPSLLYAILNFIAPGGHE